jgi:hypothetical protein
MKIYCPSCNQRYDVSEEDAGSMVTCQICQTDFQISPTVASEPVPATVGPVPQARPASPQRSLAQQWTPRPGLAGSPGTLLPGQNSPLRVLLNVRLFLQWLGDGSLIRNVTAGGLGLMAILATFVCIGIWISSLTLFGDAEGIIGILGVLLWLIFFPYAAYLSIGAILVRANEIRNLSASEYSISPILNILLGLQGEVVFILAIVGSVPLTLMTWAFYAQMAGAFDLPATDGFLIGIMVLLGTLGIGYGAYLLSRFMQEFLFVLPSIARNVDLMRKQKSDEQKGRADAA